MSGLIYADHAGKEVKIGPVDAYGAKWTIIGRDFNPFDKETVPETNSST